MPQNDPDVTDYPVNSYVLYTPPMGRSNKLLARHKGPYQVIGKRQSIYIIEDLVKGKQIKTHVHNLRPFVFNPTQVNPLGRTSKVLVNQPGRGPALVLAEFGTNTVEKHLASQ